MTAAELHADCSRRGVYPWAEKGKLRFRAAPGALTPELREMVREQRRELVELLAGQGAEWRQAEASGLSRQHACRIVPEPHRLREPFPLTDVQQGYWLGRLETFELAAAAQLYLEIETPVLEPQRLVAAWDRLVKRHPMLRAVVLPDGHMQVLKEVPSTPLQILDLRQEGFEVADDQLLALRKQLSQHGPTPEQWPLFDLRLSRRAGVERIHLGISLLICDALSWRLLLRQVTRLYLLEAEQEDQEPPPVLSFRDYVLAQRAQEESADYRRSLDFWRRRLDALPAAPQLPLVRSPEDVQTPTFVRRQATLEADLWQGFQQRTRGAKVTPTVALATAYAATLAAWSGEAHFLLNMLFFNRLPRHPQIDEVVGNFTSTILLEVNLDPALSFEANAQRLQARLLEDLDHAQVSGVRVLRELQGLRGGSRHAVPVVFASTLRLDGGVTPPPAGDDKSEEDGAISLEVVHSTLQTPQVWLDHQVTEREGTLSFNWDAVSELFHRGEVRNRFEGYFDLLWQLADEEQAWTLPLGELVEAMPAASTSVARPSEPSKRLAVAPSASGTSAPRNAVEEALAGIWRELLQVPEVGIHDNFFAHGGQSLLAVRMLARVHRELGRDLPMSVLFEGGTIAHLAEALRSQETARRSPLVLIHGASAAGAEAAQRPFFCVHPVGGSVLCYQPLAEALGKNRPFYGLQSLPGMRGWSLEAMAEHYVAAVREVQAEGPYLLGGWSFGAVAAFEMARQLGAAGQEVRSLMMIDLAPVNLHDRSPEVDVPFLLRRFGEDLAALSGVVDFDTSSEDLPGLARRLAAAGVEMAGEFEVFERLFETFGSNYRALLAYVPETCAGPVSLFQAVEGGDGLEADAGWGGVVEGEVRVVAMAADHYSIVQMPGVLELARRFQAEFDQD